MLKRKKMKMKAKYMSRPSYPECDILGKTFDTVGGTIARRPVQRALITTDAAADGKVIVDGDDVVIKAVTPVTEIETQIELCDGQKSAASWKFFDCFRKEAEEGKDYIEIFTTAADDCVALCECARHMCERNPGCAGQWKIVEKGKDTRVVIRLFTSKVNSNGLIAE